MSAADAAVGIMDGAYFVGRKELLEFFNDLLDLQLTKIEQTAPGAIACQVTELIFPGSIPMSRVNWEAKSDYEFVQNYKLLQAAFTKHKVQRHVDVDKLIRAKYQDNLEFCQWLKAFYDQATGGGGVAASSRPVEYDPAAVRAKGKGGKKYNQLQGSGRGSAGRGGGRPGAETTLRSRVATNTTTGNRPRPAAATKPVNARSPVPASSRTPNGQSQSLQQTKQLEQENAQLLEKVVELETTLEEVEQERDQIVLDVEKERDFYFGKLRSIEVMLQVHQERDGNEGGGNGNGNDGSEDTTAVMHDLVDRMFQILYATAEDNLTVNAEGQVVPADAVDDNDNNGNDGDVEAPSQHGDKSPRRGLPLSDSVGDETEEDVSGDSLLKAALDE